MPDIREVPEGETQRVAPALLELRVDAGPLERLIKRVDAQRAAGYRVVGAFEGDEDAQAVIAFKVTENLVWGRYLSRWNWSRGAASGSSQRARQDSNL